MKTLNFETIVHYMYVQKIEELKDWIVKKESEMS